MRKLLISVLLGTVASVATAGVEDKYNQSCTFCHSTGAAGAPKTGDAAAWAPRLEKGMDTLVENVVNGYKGMPAKGMCNDCSADDMKALIEYMAK